MIEFMLVESLDAGELGRWFMLLAIVMAIMNWIAHHMMRRARHDPENAAFFEGVERAEGPL